MTIDDIAKAAAEEIARAYDHGMDYLECDTKAIARHFAPLAKQAEIGRRAVEAWIDYLENDRSYEEVDEKAALVILDARAAGMVEKPKC